ncbi:MAG: outer membrane beta-barrel protein [Acidobacteriota bacterium]|nr:outer membrane beta-barrel protein [Acidobacteriota bacterium]MDH3523768.1 outer membrane beta-barrel protein [Acidobacteriota bacterium]
MKTITRFILAAALVALLPAAAATAAAPEEGWRLRFNGYWVDTNDVEVGRNAVGYRSRVENKAAAGGGVSGEYRFGRRLGVELGLLAGAEVGFTSTFEGGSVAATNTMAFDAACVGLNVHLTQGERVDLYAGPLVAYVSYADMQLGVTNPPPGWPVVLVPASVTFGDGIALGANLGVDVPIGQRRWFFNADLKYLDANPDATLGATGAVALRDSVAIDPLMVGIGFGYRF